MESYRDLIRELHGVCMSERKFKEQKYSLNHLPIIGVVFCGNVLSGYLGISGLCFLALFFDDYDSVLVSILFVY